MRKYTYEVGFMEALDRTHSWGVKAPGFAKSSQPVLDEQGLQVLTKEVQEQLGHLDAEAVSQQCFAVTLFLKDQLEERLGVPLTYTLGYVELEKKPVFFTPEEELKAMIGTPLHARPIQLHAWLTTPAYEIIDITLSTTYGIVNDAPECVGRVMAQHYSELTDGLVYHPQVIGDDFLGKIGAILEVSWQ